MVARLPALLLLLPLSAGDALFEGGLALTYTARDLQAVHFRHHRNGSARSGSFRW
jgi:hypothetical protein